MSNERRWRRPSNGLAAFLTHSYKWDPIISSLNEVSACRTDTICINRSSQLAPDFHVRPVLTRESPLPIPQTQSAFHRHAQRNAFRRRGARQESQTVRPSESAAETQPQLQPALLRLGANRSMSYMPARDTCAPTLSARAISGATWTSLSRFSRKRSMATRTESSFDSSSA